MKESLKNRTLGLGLLVILIGLVFLLRQMDVFSYSAERIIFSWQMLLIALGVFFLTFGENRTVGFILVVIGGFFILPEIFDLPYNFRRAFWPVLLILLGLFILSRSGLFGRRSHEPAPGPASADSLFLDEVNVFSGADRKISGVTLKGGKITSIFGGSEIDLSEATLDSGNNVIELFYLFGGSTLTVPRDWHVINQVTAILGGFSDKRSGIVTPDSKPEKILILRGLVIFGGGEIKSP